MKFLEKSTKTLQPPVKHGTDRLQNVTAMAQYILNGIDKPNSLTDFDIIRGLNNVGDMNPFQDGSSRKFEMYSERNDAFCRYLHSSDMRHCYSINMPNVFISQTFFKLV